MTPILKTLREVREALENAATKIPWSDRSFTNEAIASLNSLIAEVEKAEPVAWIDWDYGENDEQFAFTTAKGCGIPVYRHPAPATPEGWQLVPKEPTPEMKEAYRLSTIQFDTLTYSAYRAMLAAAPEPKP